VAFEWFGTVVTAATGLAGITFTWLTARAGLAAQARAASTQQELDQRRLIRSERREQYLAYLDCLDRFEIEAAHIKLSMRHALQRQSPDAITPDDNPLMESLGALRNASNGVRLVAGPETRGSIDAIYDAVEMATTAIVFGGNIRVATIFDRSAIYFAMRRELGFVEGQASLDLD
jgi:hypothetical protein